ncbi:MAG: response regulator transcription factor [Bacteroidales bacterium]|nr:response regulator transcription factor [Clostridium sp.]MCM1204534.1 response regulator transcription factor [Bacteroidales bacterium]
MQKILIAEDDEKLRNELALFLNRNGYEAEGLKKYDNTLSDIERMDVDLILLDINLPDTDGEFILKELRKVSDTPVIMITSRDSEMDELLSMHYGADDYVTKPFNIQILLAKITAILKRTNNPALSEKINCGSFILNISKSRLEKGNDKIELTGNELKIVKCLVRSKGKIVSREDMMNDLWDSEAFIDDNTLTVNIARIRKKFEEIGLQDVIETRRGQGYILQI